MGCGPSDLFINANLGLNADCEFVADPELALSRAEYDIAHGGSSGSDACRRPYLAHLLVRNDSDEDVVVESAEVRLQSVQRQTIVFNRNVPLPNPFLIQVGSPVPAEASAAVPVEVVPMDYGDQLNGFVGGSILVEVGMQGATSDADLGSNVFSFTLAICDGCRTICASAPGADNVGNCSSLDLGVDREICVDDGC